MGCVGKLGGRFELLGCAAVGCEVSGEAELDGVHTGGDGVACNRNAPASARVVRTGYVAGFGGQVVWLGRILRLTNFTILYYNTLIYYSTIHALVDDTTRWGVYFRLVAIYYTSIYYTATVCNAYASTYGGRHGGNVLYATLLY